MDGKIVKKSIQLSNKKLGQVASALGITREHFQRMLKGDVSDIYVEKIKKLGIKITDVTISEVSEPHPSYVIKEKFDVLLEQTIDDYRKHMEALMNTNKVLTKIVDVCWEGGAFSVDSPKARKLIQKLG